MYVFTNFLPCSHSINPRNETSLVTCAVSLTCATWLCIQCFFSLTYPSTRIHIPMYSIMCVHRVYVGGCGCPNICVHYTYTLIQYVKWIWFFKCTHRHSSVTAHYRYNIPIVMLHYTPEIVNYSPTYLCTRLTMSCLPSDLYLRKYPPTYVCMFDHIKSLFLLNYAA